MHSKSQNRNSLYFRTSSLRGHGNCAPHAHVAGADEKTFLTESIIEGAGFLKKMRRAATTFQRFVFKKNEQLCALHPESPIQPQVTASYPRAHAAKSTRSDIVVSRAYRIVTRPIAGDGARPTRPMPARDQHDENSGRRFQVFCEAQSLQARFQRIES